MKLSGNYTYLLGSTELKENGVWNKKDFLVRRPAHQLTILADIPFNKKLSTHLTYQFVEKRIDLVYDDATFATVQKDLAAYHWVDLSFSYQVHSKARINLLFKNVLNQKITELYGYNGVPVMGQVGVNYEL